MWWRWWHERAVTMFSMTLAVLLLAVPAAEADVPEIAERSSLRVCSDGNNLPFSNRAGEGFENRIAEMMAADLGLPLTYVWSPQIVGFVRNTLELRVCDVIIGVAAGYELVQNSKPYYRSVYSVVLPADSTLAPTQLTDQVFRGMRVGAISDTPPVVPLRQAGARVTTYALQVDTRVRSSAREAINDVAAGATEAAVLWGPIAGFYAATFDPPLKVVPLDARNASTPPIDYRITMGIRRNEPQWRDWINEFIDRRQAEIDRLLIEYGVPLINVRGELLQSDPTGGAE